MKAILSRRIGCLGPHGELGSCVNDLEVLYVPLSSYGDANGESPLWLSAG